MGYKTDAESLHRAHEWHHIKIHKIPLEVAIIPGATPFASG